MTEEISKKRTGVYVIGDDDRGTPHIEAAVNVGMDTFRSMRQAPLSKGNGEIRIEAFDWETMDRFVRTAIESGVRASERQKRQGLLARLLGRRATSPLSE